MHPHPASGQTATATFTARPGLITLGQLTATATVESADPKPDTGSTLTATASCTALTC
ncbi:hypothetical protein ACIHEI_06440 [Kitasatospora sp. NPDC051984]|uniref:hypothetical protein n=1 Tax=Kitasatospora sp. NPDC051984 TaxID=3364059 RepID=UPI0037C74171